jgi:hypothetical protein
VTSCARSWGSRKLDSDGMSESIRRLAKNNGWLLWILLAGVLLLIPGKSAGHSPPKAERSNEELRLAETLSRVDGVGEASVLLAEKPGREEGFLGAVVVCPGADRPEVRLRIVEIVAAFTGLGSHQIVVQKMIS